VRSFLPYITPRLYFGSKDRRLRQIAGHRDYNQAQSQTVRWSWSLQLRVSPPLMNEAGDSRFSTRSIPYFGRGYGQSRGMRRDPQRRIQERRVPSRGRAGSDAPDRQNIHGPICLNGKNAALFMHDEKFEDRSGRGSICILLETEARRHLP